jgi:hypothetical protein
MSLTIGIKRVFVRFKMIEPQDADKSELQ